MRILEIGCGTGRHTTKLAARGNTVTALDVSSGMLAEARRKLAGRDVEFVPGDFLTHQFPESALFDLIIVSLVLEHVTDLDSFFHKCAQILSRDGRLMLSEIHPVRSAAGILAHFKDPESGEEFHLESCAHSHDSIVTAAQNAGLSLSLQEDVHGDERLAQINSKWAKYLGQPMISIWIFGNSPTGGEKNADAHTEH